MTAPSKNPVELLNRMRNIAIKERLAETAQAVPALAERKQSPRRHTVRYTIDLDRAQQRFLRVFAIQHDTEVAALFRAFARLLERDPTFADRVLDEL